MTLSLIIRLTSVTKFIYLRDTTIVKFIKNSKIMISNHGDYKFIKEGMTCCEIEELANAVNEWMNPYEYRAIVKDNNDKIHMHGFFIPNRAIWKECEPEKFNIYR